MLALLPTGFGKSLIYQYGLFLSGFDPLPRQDPAVLVVRAAVHDRRVSFFRKQVLFANSKVYVYINSVAKMLKIKGFNCSLSGSTVVPVISYYCFQRLCQ